MEAVHVEMQDIFFAHLGKNCLQLKVTYNGYYSIHSRKLNGCTCIYFCLHCMTIGLTNI